MSKISNRSNNMNIVPIQKTVRAVRLDEYEIEPVSLKFIKCKTLDRSAVKFMSDFYYRLVQCPLILRRWDGLSISPLKNLVHCLNLSSGRRRFPPET